MSRKLIALAVLLAAGCGGTSFSEHLEYARLNRENGRLAEAIESYEAALALEPGRTDVSVELARVHLERNEPDAARVTLRAALEAAPASAEARTLLVRSYLAEDRYPEAGEAVDEIRAAGVLPILTLVLRAEVDLSHSVHLIREALRAARSRPEVLRPARLLLAVDRGDLEGAERLLLEWSGGGTIPGVSSRIAAALRRRLAAREAVERAIQAEPDREDARRIRGELLVLAGRAGEAIPDLEVAAAEGAAPETRRAALGLLITAHESRGEPGAALAAATRAVAEDPRDEVARLTRALLRIRNRLLPEALEDAKTLEKLRPGSLYAAYVSGVVATIRGRVEEGEAALARAATIPRDPGPRFWYGLSLLAGEKRELAAATFREALDLSPNHAMAHVGLAWTSLLAGETAVAIEHAERAVETRPGDPALKCILARILLARAEEIGTDIEESRRLSARAERLMEEVLPLSPATEGGAEAPALVDPTRGAAEAAPFQVLDGLADRPADGRLLTLAGTIESRRGHTRSARELFTKAIAARPDLPDPRLGLAGLEDATGHPEEARRVLRELLRVRPRFAAGRLALAANLPIPKGVELLAEGLRLAPGDAALHFGRVALLRRAGDDTAVLDALREATEALPGDPRIADTALHEIEAGRAEAGLAIAEAAAERFGSAPSVQAVLAVARAAGGRADPAAEAAARLCALAPDLPFAAVLLVDLRLLAGDTDRAEMLARHTPGFSRVVREQLIGVATTSLSPRVERAIAARDRSIAWHLTGRWPARAARAAEAALAVFPSDPITLEILACTRSRIGDREGARRACRELLRIDPALLSARVRIAESLLAEGRAEEARSELEIAVEAGLRDADALFLLARLLVSDGRAEEALATAARAARAADESPRALRLLAAFQEEAGSPGTARRTLERGLLEAPRSPDLMAALARLLAILGEELDRAAELARSAIHLRPRASEARHALALVELRRGRTDAALEAVRDALSLRPDRTAYRATHGEILFAMDRFEEAETELRYAAEHGRGDARVEIALALLLDRRGETAQAARRYEAALRLNEGSWQAANNLACIYLREGKNRDRARELAARAVETSDRSAATLDTLAWAMIRANEPEWAIEVLDEALRKAPGNPDLLRRMAEARTAATR